VEYCELCSTGLGREHPHLVELVSRQILCACDGCALLFDAKENSRYKRVPRSARFLAGFELSDAQWEGLLIPINMAFFFHCSIDGKMMAFYPSPAGAVESLLPLEAWSEIAGNNPALRQMQPDVEALLVNRVGFTQGTKHAEYYIAPIDQCYKLVGLIRTHWRGLSGGTEVWTEIRRFFLDLRSKSDPIGVESNSIGGANA
jgi:hypothetical protein